MALNDTLDLSRLPDNARAGLRSPQVVTLNAGQGLFRFSSTSSPQHLWAAGPWWMYEHDYQKIVAEYQLSRARHGEDGLTLGYLGRAAMAVKQSWSKMDVVVKAIVSQDIKAFAGLGRSQFNERMPNGIRITWKGWPNVQQLFIPNISDKHGLTLAGQQALLVLGQSFVASQQIF
jgi:hypothetical protein